MGYDQRRQLQALYDIRHGKCLAGSGHAEKRLVFGAVVDFLDELVYGLRLVARGFEIGR